MRGLFRPALAAALLIAVPAVAQDDPAGRLTAEVRAADDAGREPPRLSDPAAAPGVRAAFDIAGVSGVHAMDLASALAVCGPRTEAVMAYLLFDVAPDATPSAIGETMGRNGLRFQDEIVLGLRAQIRCTAGLESAAERFIKGLAEADRVSGRRQGAAQMRAGVAQMLTGVVMMSVERTTRAANRDLALDESVLQAEPLSRMIAPADRAQVIAVIDQALPQATEASVRDRLTKLRTALSRTDCGTVCAF